MITLVVIFCMQLNPTMCRELEMVPVGREITSIMDCIIGGAIGGVEYEKQQFKLEGIVWRVEGYRCREQPTVVQTWRADRVTP